MQLRIVIDLDNAAFRDESGVCDVLTEEVRRVLTDLTDRLPNPMRPTRQPMNLHDANGNQCGTAEIVSDEPVKNVSIRRADALARLSRIRKPK